MLCVNCGTNLPEGAKFCMICGTKQPEELKCPGCGMTLPEGARFCMSCGTPIGNVVANVGGQGNGNVNPVVSPVNVGQVSIQNAVPVSGANAAPAAVPVVEVSNSVIYTNSEAVPQAVNNDESSTQRPRISESGRIRKPPMAAGYL